MRIKHGQLAPRGPGSGIACRPTVQAGRTRQRADASPPVDDATAHGNEFAFGVLDYVKRPPGGRGSGGASTRVGRIGARSARMERLTRARSSSDGSRVIPKSDYGCGRARPVGRPAGAPTRVRSQSREANGHGQARPMTCCAAVITRRYRSLRNLIAKPHVQETASTAPGSTGGGCHVPGRAS